MSLFNQIIFSQKPNIATGLIGWWTFNEGTGSTAFDSGSGASNMTLTNSPTWITGKIGPKGLNFSGSTYAQTGNDTALLQLGGTQSLSLAAWFRTSSPITSSMSGICITNGGQFSGQYDKGIGMTVDNRAGFYYFQSPLAHIISGSTLINDGNWHHICATFNGKQVKMFVDGRMEAYQPATSTFQFAAANMVASLVTGGSGSALGTWQSFKGDIDDIRVYNRELSTEDIRSLFRQGSVPDINTGLAGWWKFDEGTGSNAADSSGNGNTGSLINSPTWAAGIVGSTSLLLAKASDKYVNLGNPTALQITKSLTLSVWANYTSQATSGDIGYIFLSKDTNTGRSYVLDFEQASATLRFYINGGTSLVSTPFSASLGKWYHFAGTYNSSTLSMSLYINGILKNTTGVTDTSINNTTTNVLIGRRLFPSFTEPFDGKLDDARIYNRALSAVDIDALYNNGFGSNINNNLVAWYRFDEGAGTVASDSSGNSRNANLLNSATWATGTIGPWAVNTSATNATVSASAITMSPIWSISTWTNFPLVGTGYKTLMRNDVGVPNGNHHVLVNPSNQLGCYLNSDATGFHDSGYNVGSLSGWHHLVAIGSGSTTQFYIDALPVGTSNAQATDVLTSLGNWGGGGSQQWGTFDDFRIYNRVLSTTEITSLYNFR